MYDVDDFVTKLLESDDTLEQNKNNLLSVLDSATRSVVKNLDMDNILNDFEDNLWELFQKDTPPFGIRLLHFGLSESVDGCSLYIGGTRDRQPPEFRDMDEWDWLPGKHGIIRLPVLQHIWDRISSTHEESWQVILAIVAIILHAYFKDNSANFLEMTNMTDPILTFGFDDGDVYDIPITQ